jgi:5-methylcytosine-specific restriction enzyme A
MKTPSVDFDETDILRERGKARELRQSQWWKRRRASGVCHYCGRRFPPAELTMDHIVPLARGGRSTKGNIAPCCKECNNLKKHLLPIEWDLYIERIRKGTNLPRSGDAPHDPDS